MQIEYFVTVLSGKTFRFILVLYQGIWKIGHEFGGLSLRSPARASPFQGIYFDSLRVETHSPQNQNQQTHRSLFSLQISRQSTLGNIGFHNALGRGSTRKWSIDEFTKSQGNATMGRAVGKIWQQPCTVQHVRYFQLIGSVRTCYSEAPGSDFCSSQWAHLSLTYFVPRKRCQSVDALRIPACRLGYICPAVLKIFYKHYIHFHWFFSGFLQASFGVLGLL